MIVSVFNVLQFVKFFTCDMVSVLGDVNCVFVVILVVVISICCV